MQKEIATRIAPTGGILQELFRFDYLSGTTVETTDYIS
jgi:hypothetical protein